MSKIGRQTPRILYARDHEHTDGPDAGELSASYGLVPDEWQQLCLNNMLATDEYGTYLHQTCGALVPRQNGKNGLIEMLEFYKPIVQGRKVLHTAHQVKTSYKAFDRLCEFYDEKRATAERSFPEIYAEVDYIRKTNGQEAIFLKNGGSIEFIARSKRSGRGFTVDDVICDEAQYMTDDELAALSPTMAAAPSGDPQTYFFGTPPEPGEPGTVFKNIRDGAVKQDNETLAWLEWSAATDRYARHKREWYKANPALGIRISEKFLAAESKKMQPEDFAREYLCYWAADAGDVALNPENWHAAKTTSPPTEGIVSYGVRFNYRGSYVAIAAARKDKDKPIHGEVIYHKNMNEGVAWIADFLADRANDAATIVIDGLSGADDLELELHKRGVSKAVIQRAKTGEVITANSMLLNALVEKTVTHFGQEGLDESALKARRRPIGKAGGWGFVGSDDLDVSPIEAFALAHWGARTSKRKPGRRMRLL